MGCPCREGAFSTLIPPVWGTSALSQELCRSHHSHLPARTPAAKEVPISGTAEKMVGEKSANPEILGRAPSEKAKLQPLPRICKARTLLEEGNETPRASSGELPAKAGEEGAPSADALGPKPDFTGLLGDGVASRDCRPPWAVARAEPGRGLGPMRAGWGEEGGTLQITYWQHLADQVPLAGHLEILPPQGPPWLCQVQFENSCQRLLFPLSILQRRKLSQ